jgi:hypothetical protein
LTPTRAAAMPVRHPILSRGAPRPATSPLRGDLIRRAAGCRQGDGAAHDLLGVVAGNPRDCVGGDDDALAEVDGLDAQANDAERAVLRSRSPTNLSSQ